MCKMKRYFHTPLYCTLSFSLWFTFISVPAKFNKNMEYKFASSNPFTLNVSVSTSPPTVLLMHVDRVRHVSSHSGLPLVNGTPNLSCQCCDNKSQGYLINMQRKKNSPPWIDAPCLVNDSFFFFKKGINSILCLPPSPSTQIGLPLRSKLIPRANLPTMIQSQEGRQE